VVAVSSSAKLVTRPERTGRGQHHQNRRYGQEKTPPHRRKITSG